MEGQETCFLCEWAGSLQGEDSDDEDSDFKALQHIADGEHRSCFHLHPASDFVAMFVLQLVKEDGKRMPPIPVLIEHSCEQGPLRAHRVPSLSPDNP